MRLTVSFGAAGALLLIGSAAAAQAEAPAVPLPPAKVEYRRVCTTQAITGGLIRKQRTCARVAVTAAPPAAPAGVAASAPAAPAAAPAGN